MRISNENQNYIFNKVIYKKELMILSVIDY
jgi:hypothetical protein